MTRVGDTIFAWREHAGMSQATLAEKAGISPTTLSTIESGRNERPHRSTLLKIGRVLEAEPDDFLEGITPQLKKAPAPLVTR